jgi:L-lysine exporter family protein LysE/ArgO
MMIIREGLVRGRVILVASLILASYVALLLLSYGMTDAIAARSTAVAALLSSLGLAAMAWFAIVSIKAAIRAESRRLETRGAGEPLPSCLRRVMLVVLVNPLVYVEFLLIPSGALGAFKEPSLRLEFTIGLIAMAALACFGYAAGGRACAGLFRHRRAMQMFDLACGCLLAMLAFTMGVGLLQSQGA